MATRPLLCAHIKSCPLSISAPLATQVISARATEVQVGMAQRAERQQPYMLLGIVPLVIFLMVIIDIAVGAAAIAIVMAFVVRYVSRYLPT